MDVQTVCIPLADDGTIQGLLAQARSVAICKVDGDAVNDWREYIVGWDTPMAWTSPAYTIRA